MRTTSRCLVLLLCGCATADPSNSDLGQAEVEVKVSTSVIPPDGQCAEVTATRLSDFSVTTKRSALQGFTFKPPSGEHRITATAYPPPCGQPPAVIPWVADELLATFSGGNNQITLSFKKNASVDVDAIFETDAALSVVPGSLVRTGRNGEDAAGPNFALDAWEVKHLALPSPNGGGGGGTETTLFSVEGQGGIPYSPRGMARLDDGRFVFQVGETFQPLFARNPDGSFEQWPVIYPTGMVVWDVTDGIDTYGTDGAHLVRTGFLNAPVGCDENGEGCIQAGIEILRLDTIGGVTTATVERQINLQAPGIDLPLEYPVGVTAGGDIIIVVTLPDGADTGKSRVVRLAPSPGDPDSFTVTQAPLVDASLEGIFIDDGVPRLLGLDYNGKLYEFNASLTSLLAAVYHVGVDLSIPISIVWEPLSARLVALSRHDRQIVFADPTFTSIVDTGIQLPPRGFDPGNPNAGYRDPQTIALLPGNLVGIVDRIPPRDGDPNTGPRIPRLDRYSLATGGFDSSLLLTGIPGSLRPRSFTYIGPRNAIAILYRLSTGFDPDFDPVVYLHDATTGAQIGDIDFKAYGVRQIGAVSYSPETDELMFNFLDNQGVLRLMITDRFGNPKRSARMPVDGVLGVARIATGPLTGQIAVSVGEPGSYHRLIEE